MLTKQGKVKLIETFGSGSKDTGSTSVQVALLTSRIDLLTNHFKTNTRDHHSRRGLLKLVGQRRRLLEYLKKTDLGKYKSLIESLNIRK